MSASWHLSKFWHPEKDSNPQHCAYGVKNKIWTYILDHCPKFYIKLFWRRRMLYPFELSGYINTRWASLYTLPPYFPGPLSGATLAGALGLEPRLSMISTRRFWRPLQLPLCDTPICMADAEGFEPSDRLSDQQISNLPHSASLPRVHILNKNQEIKNQTLDG